MSTFTLLSALRKHVAAWVRDRERSGQGHQSPIQLLSGTLATNPHGWLIEPNRIHRNGVEISWQGPVATAADLKVKVDGRLYPVLRSEAPNLRKALQTLHSFHAMPPAERPNVVQLYPAVWSHDRAHTHRDAFTVSQRPELKR